jgi:hypothetical protein
MVTDGEARLRRDAPEFNQPACAAPRVNGAWLRVDLRPLPRYKNYNVKRLVPLVAGVAALAAATAVLAAPTTTATARLVSVTSPVRRNAHATLVAHVVPARRCTITVLYKSGASHAQGLSPKRPTHGYVTWKWKVGGNTTLGIWPIQVSCGSAGSFRTHFRVIR